MSQLTALVVLTDVSFKLTRSLAAMRIPSRIKLSSVNQPKHHIIADSKSLERRMIFSIHMVTSVDA